MASKQIIGDPLIINGRTLSLSKAIRAGDFIFLTGQVPIKNGEIVVKGSIEEQTVIVIEEIKNICKSENIDIKQLAPRFILAIIDRWKNKGYYPSEVIVNKIGRASCRERV